MGNRRLGRTLSEDPREADRQLRWILQEISLVYKYRVNSRMVGKSEVIQGWPSN